MAEAVSGAPAAAVTQAPFFEGFYVDDSGSTENINCATTEFFSMSGSHAGCCAPDQPCDIITSCADGTVTGIPGAIGCLPPGGCVTMTVFDSFPTGGPVYSNLICADNWAATSIYRNLDAQVTPSSSASSTRSSSRTTTSKSASRTSSASDTSDTSATTATSQTSTGILASQTSSTTASPSSSTTPAGGSTTSQAWIAGAVIGPIALILLIALAFWLGRRSSRRKATQQGQIVGYTHAADKNHGAVAAASEVPGSYHYPASELNGNGTGYVGHDARGHAAHSPPVELPGGGREGYA